MRQILGRSGRGIIGDINGNRHALLDTYVLSTPRLPWSSSSSLCRSRRRSPHRQWTPKASVIAALSPIPSPARPPFHLHAPHFFLPRLCLSVRPVFGDTVRIPVSSLRPLLLEAPGVTLLSHLFLHLVDSIVFLPSGLVLVTVDSFFPTSSRPFSPAASLVGERAGG